MKNHLYQSKNGLIHLCQEGFAGAGEDTKFIFTNCDKDVPAGKSFKSHELVTCPDCVRNMLWGCKDHGDGESPKCHKCVREDGKLVTDELT